MRCCCDRSDHGLGGPWFGRTLEFGAEKSLSVQSLLGCCENLEDNAEGNVEDGDLAVKFQMEHLKAPLKGLSGASSDILN